MARLALVAIFFYFASIAELLAQEKSFKKRFLDEYVPAVKKLKDFYGNVRIRAAYTYKGAFLQPPQTLDFRRDLVFKARDPHFLVEATGSEKDRYISAGETYVRGINRKYSFLVQKRPDDKNLLAKLVANDQRGWEFVRFFGNFALAPYCWNDDTLEDFLGSKYNEIPSWEEIVADNRRLVKVSYHYKFEKLNYGGWFLFSPENSWALLEHGREKNDLKLHLVISYEDLKEEIPRIKEVKNYQKDPTGLGEEKWKIVEFTPGPIPEEEFRLSYYGLPEPKGITWPKPTPFYLWFMGIGFACVVFGVFLRHWLKKRNSIFAKTNVRQT